MDLATLMGMQNLQQGGGFGALDKPSRTGLLLYGLGDIFKGGSGQGTIALGGSMMDSAEERRKKAAEAAAKAQADNLITGMFGGGGQTVGGGASSAPRKTALEMMYPQGRTVRNDIAPDGRFVSSAGSQWDTGYVDPWQGKEDVRAGIFAGESGGDYDAVFGYQQRPGGRFEGVRPTDMTVGEVLQFQDPQGEYGQFVKGQVGRVATPVGAYQVVGSTLRDAVEAGVVDPNARFDQATQDKIGRWVLDTQGTGAWEGFRGAQSPGSVPAGSVQTAQAGGMDRAQLVQLLRNEQVPNEVKQFALAEYKARQGGQGGKDRYMNVGGVLYDVSGPQPVPVTEAQNADPAAVQKIERIKQAYGVDDRTAVGIADGVLRVSRDPFTDQIQITNLATNEVFTPSVSGQAAPAQGDASQPEADPDLSFGQAYQGAGSAFGLGGMVRGGVNAVSDFVAGQPVFPETAQTQRDFAVLREDLTQDMQSAYGQRVPSWALQAIRDLTPAAGTFEGAGAAQSKLTSLGRKIEQELQSVEGALGGRGARTMSPQARAEMEAQASGLLKALGKVQTALQGFQGGDVQLRPEVEDRLKAYQ